MAKKDWMIKESELDEDQIQVLMATLDKSCIVSGCAGSGKSILALIKAQRIEREKGKNYKIIVYTKALCNYMNEGRKMLGLTNSFVYHWEWKNRQYCRGADYIIVDEIQDFTEQEVKEFINAAGKHFFFFGDTAQSLYEGMKRTVKVEGINRLLPNDSLAKSFELYRNYRLPIDVARFAQYVGVDLSPFIESTYKSDENEKPRILRYGDFGDQVEAISRIIKAKGFKDVAILLPTNDKVKEVGNTLSRLGQNVELKYKEDRDGNSTNVETLDFSTENPKVMTYHSAKGLQFEAVFLPCLEDFHDDGDGRRKALYVAITRTYRYLYVMYSGNLPGVLSRIPQNLYKTTETDVTEDM